jgi:hypothetical protein
MEDILLDTMFELPNLEGVEKVVITKQVVEGTASPPLRSNQRRERLSAASAAGVRYRWPQQKIMRSSVAKPVRKLHFDIKLEQALE